MEEVFDATLIADETEPFVDEKSCDGPARHTRSPPFAPEDIPGCSADVGNLTENPPIFGVAPTGSASNCQSSWKLGQSRRPIEGSQANRRMSAFRQTLAFPRLMPGMSSRSGGRIEDTPSTDQASMAFPQQDPASPCCLHNAGIE